MQPYIHYFLHLVFPAFLALLLFRKDWKKAYLLLLLTMLVDLDHLSASPIFEPHRCSIGYHALHSYYAIGLYVLFLFLHRPFKILGTGLLFHMLTDLTDCAMTFEQCNNCIVNAAAPTRKFLLTFFELLP